MGHGTSLLRTMWTLTYVDHIHVLFRENRKMGHALLGTFKFRSGGNRRKGRFPRLFHQDPICGVDTQHMGKRTMITVVLF